MDTPIILKQLSPLTALMWIAVYFFGAWVLSFILVRITRRLLSLGRLAPAPRRPSPERTKTIQTLSSSLITTFLFFAALIASLSMFVSASTLVWIVGLFSAAFGIAARPLVSDFFAGVGFLFRETFDIGEKVEFILPEIRIQGIIESVNLSTTIIRAPSGEQFTLPNGDIRVVRNFSRGKFSQITITLQVAPEDLTRALDVLKPMGDEVFNQVDDLIEPWKIISSSNLSASRVELSILVKAVLGHGAATKLDLINLVQDRLKRENITLLD